MKSDNTNLKADHVGDVVIIRNENNDIIAKIDPESAIALSKSLLDCAEKSLRNTKEEA